jgi:hypothetical protein
MELMSKPNRPPPMMAMAAMRYTLPNCFTMVGKLGLSMRVRVRWIEGCGWSALEDMSEVDWVVAVAGGSVVCTGELYVGWCREVCAKL